MHWLLVAVAWRAAAVVTVVALGSWVFNPPTQEWRPGDTFRVWAIDDESLLHRVYLLVGPDGETVRVQTDCGSWQASVKRPPWPYAVSFSEFEPIFTSVCEGRPAIEEAATATMEAMRTVQSWEIRGEDRDLIRLNGAKTLLVLN